MQLSISSETVSTHKARFDGEEGGDSGAALIRHAVTNGLAE